MPRGKYTGPSTPYRPPAETYTFADTLHPGWSLWSPKCTMEEQGCSGYYPRASDIPKCSGSSGLVRIRRYDFASQLWVTYDFGSAYNNFYLNQGQGYMVYANNTINSFAPFRGYAFSYIELRKGWNCICLPTWFSTWNNGLGYWASDLCQRIVQDTSGATPYPSVMQWIPSDVYFRPDKRTWPDTYIFQTSDTWCTYNYGDDAYKDLWLGFVGTAFLVRSPMNVNIWL